MNLFLKYKILTEDFKSWFGKSVLHDNGVPHTFYHGTSSEFSEFKSGHGNQWGSGHYFTRSPKLASDYATGDTSGNHARIAPDGNSSPNVMPVHLRMIKPFVMDDVMTNETKKHIEKHLGQSLTDYTWPKMKNRDIRQVLHQQFFNNQDESNKLLRKIGYDGIREKSDNSTHMVFDPNQIKSVFNNGKYSKTSNNISEHAKI